MLEEQSYMVYHIFSNQYRGGYWDRYFCILYYRLLSASLRYEFNGSCVTNISDNNDSLGKPVIGLSAVMVFQE